MRWLLALLWLLAAGAQAHELQPGFLELREGQERNWQVLWKQPLSAGQPLRLTPVFPAPCAPLGTASQERLPQAWVYRARIHCPQGLAGQKLAVEGLEAFATDVLVRVEHADGRVETHLLKPDQPQLQLAALGERTQTTYLWLGIEHIALGFDHLLFVFGLLLLVGSNWMLVKTITSFTVAHSITLGLATLTSIHVPPRPLELAIALSILFLAPEILRLRAGGSSLSIRHPWVVAFAFGLLHGFGFASALREVGLPRDEIPLALLLFNVGVEFGQLAFVALVLAAGALWRRLAPWRTPALALAPVYLIGTLSAWWTWQRLALWLAPKLGGAA